MGNLLYIVAVFLILIWGISFFAYNAGNFIHFFLFIALATLIFRIVQESNLFKNKSLK
ncbi:MAG TPA: lmo0937 family membrane protein [Bacteroidales bacterium]|nr:lmo0937 family membrane protein [Bacteroidales bacterium]